MLKIAVLVSGRGTNLQCLIDAIQRGKLNAQIAVVVSNQAGAPALERARRAGIATEVLAAQKGEGREDYDRRLAAILKDRGVDLIVLAGFMRILSAFFVRTFKNRVINIHPSLLPAFPGLEAQRQALEYGARTSGCTVHFVDEGCDTGPVILQAVVDVRPDDTVESLAARILEKEHEILPKAIDLIARGRLHLAGRRVLVKE